MRIQCENCDATYTIDDTQLSEQPIGAQCPYCGHVKLVRRGDDAAQPAAPAMSGGSESGYGHAYDPFAAGGAQPPAPPAFNGPSTGGLGAGAPAAPPGAANPFGGGSPFAAPPERTQGPAVGGWGSSDLSSADLSSSDLNALPSPAGQPPAPFGGGAPFAGAGAFPDPSAGFASDLGMPGSGAQGGAAPDSDARCQVCSVALTDEFDKVIGLCDEHQRDRRGDGGGAGNGEIGGDEAAHWHVRTHDGRQDGPMTLEDLRNRIRGSDFSVADEFSADGVEFGPISRYKDIAYLASLAQNEVTAVPKPLRARGGPGVSIGKLVTPVLLVVVVGGLVFLGYQQREAIGRLYDGFTSSTGPSGPTTPNPLKRYMATWRLRHPDLAGAASEHLATALARHLEDTHNGYQAAERAYERALLLDENEAEAIAGYVENLAVWRYESATLDELRVAEAAAHYARELAPTAAGPYRALGALALAKGDLNGCRAGADGALQRAATDGRAKLLIAGCYLQGNVQLAISEAERAKQLMPKLRRADRLLANAYAAAGRFKSAFKALDARLAVDPANAEVHLQYGRTALLLAQHDLAGKHFRRASTLGGDTQAAYLALGELAFERRNYPEASNLFDKAARERAMHGARAARVYSGWASAELMRSRAKRAIQLADQALSFSQDDAAALLVRGQASLLAGSATTAAVYARRTLNVRAGEPSALVLQGRAAAGQRQRDKAIKSLEDAITNDPRDPRLKGILAALYLSLGGAPQAYALMRRAANIDPLEAQSRNRVGPLALSPIPVQEALAQFRKSAAEERNASVASSAMGMLYYHLGDGNRASTAISRALRLDNANYTALIYDAQLALDRGDAQRAEKSAHKLLSVERGSALGHLLLARALTAQRKVDKARVEYESALRSNPGLMAARIELAGLGLEAGDREAAIQELLTAYRVNPHSLRVRTLLFEAGI